MDNTHRFSRDQQVSDMAMLLWKLGSLCINEMETLLHGTDWKHGYLFSPISKEMYQEQREGLLDLMMDIAQELDITPVEIADAWERVTKGRRETKEWGKQWIKE